MTTGERMRARRKEMGLSADHVAAALGVSRATIFRYENGEIEKVPGPVLEPLSRILNTTPAYLMGWDDSSHLEPLVEHVSQSMETIEKAQHIAVTLAEADQFDTEVLTHPDVLRVLNAALDATKGELLDAVGYLEFQKTKR